MTRIRRIGAVVLAAGSAVLGLPLSADAATTSVLSPSNGSVITRGSSVTARAHFDFALTMELRVKTPSGDDAFLAKKSGTGDLSGTIYLQRNGTYEVYLVGRPTNHVYDHNTFKVKIPPASPSGVSASASGGKLKVNWNLGLEDDLSGYTVKASGVGSKSGSTGSFCSGTSCSASFSLPSSATGNVGVSVTAKRPSGSGGSVYSGAAAATANAGGGGGGSSLPPGSVPSLPPGTTSPTPNTPLTPFNSSSPLTLPNVQPDGATPGFAYPTPQVANQMSPKAKNVAATSSLQWGKSVGIALVLLVIAAHLGTWTRRLRVAQAGVSNRGMAARMARAGVGRKRVSKERERIARAEAIAKTATLTPPSKTPTPGKPSVASAKPDADKNATAVMKAPGVGGENMDKPRRRPAALGKRPGGVDVSIAGQETPDGKPGQTAHGRRRRGK